MKLHLALFVILLITDTCWSQCTTANWWGSFDSRGWSTCDSTIEYITGFYRNSRRSDDPIFLLEEATCCRAPSPDENRASTCTNANWWSVLDSTNRWAVCPTGYFLQGLYRSDNNYIHNIEEGRCCKPNSFPSRYEHCYNHNVGSSFDDRGLSKCNDGYYLTGIFRGGCNRLYCIETFKCCKMNIDECNNANQCQNGGICTDTAGSYSCSCQSGYYGNQCQYEIDECASVTCQNGGTCVDLVGSYRCDCATGYSGNNCETDIDDCAPAPCQNGGTCVDLVGSYRCDCPAGFLGATCDEQEMEECD